MNTYIIKRYNKTTHTKKEIRESFLVTFCPQLLRTPAISNNTENFLFSIGLG